MTMVAIDNQPSSSIGVIFSLNRAMQLQAALSSFLLLCQDFERLELFVLYKATTPDHTRQYTSLVEEFEKYPNIHFQTETSFRGDLLTTLVNQASLSPNRRKLFLNLLRLGGRFGWLGNKVLAFTRPVYVLFLVDDNLFVQPFRIQEAVEALEQHPTAIGFSLRLGKNTTYCYPDRSNQALPDFTTFSPTILKFNWTKGEHDFHYPLEVSSSLYRLKEMLPFINGLRFHNPNTLESRMAARWREFVDSHPDLLCFERSVTFCNPVNRVAIDMQNRAAEQFNYPDQFLAAQFDAGYRIEIAAYRGFLPNGCHQEVELTFKKISGE
jgi:hypothetical protein